MYVCMSLCMCVCVYMCPWVHVCVCVCVCTLPVLCVSGVGACMNACAQLRAHVCLIVIISVSPADYVHAFLLVCSICMYLCCWLLLFGCFCEFRCLFSFWFVCAKLCHVEWSSMLQIVRARVLLHRTIGHFVIVRHVLALVVVNQHRVLCYLFVERCLAFICLARPLFLGFSSMLRWLPGSSAASSNTSGRGSSVPAGVVPGTPWLCLGKLAFALTNVYLFLCFWITSPYWCLLHGLYIC